MLVVYDKKEVNYMVISVTERQYDYGSRHYFTSPNAAVNYANELLLSHLVRNGMTNEEAESIKAEWEKTGLADDVGFASTKNFHAWSDAFNIPFDIYIVAL